MRMDSERKVTAAGEPLIEFRGVDKFFDKPEEGRYQVVGDLNIKEEDIPCVGISSITAAC